MSNLPPYVVEVASGCRVRYWPSVSFDVYVEGITRRKKGPRPTFVEPGDTVLDIGANVGHTVVSYAVLVGAEGHVHAFEASPSILPFLEENVRQNGLTTVTIHPIAVSDFVGCVRFNVATNGGSALSSIRELDNVKTQAVEVPCATVDSMLHLFKRVAFVKIDVEGAELQVVRGMQQLIERDRPLLKVETTDEWIRALGGTAAELCALLTERNYKLHSLGEGGVTALETIPTHQFELLAVPSERMGERRLR